MTKPATDSAQTNTETEKKADGSDNLSDEMTLESEEITEEPSEEPSEDSNEAEEDGGKLEKKSLLSDESSEDGESESGKEEIEYKLSVSEDSPLGEEAINQVKEFAKKNGLSNEAAQEVIKSHEQTIQNFVEASQKASVEKNNEWYKDLQNDKDLGGDNFNRTQEVFKRFVKQFGDKEFIEGIEAMNVSNWKPFVRMVVKASEQAFMEDQVERMPGENPIKPPKTAGEKMYQEGDLYEEFLNA